MREHLTFWELFGLVATGMGLFASILGAWLTYASRQNGEATRALIREMQADTQATHVQIDAHWREAWERMEQRANERHTEALEMIRTLQR